VKVKPGESVALWMSSTVDQTELEVGIPK